MNWKKTLLICVVILVLSAAALLLIFNTEPTAQRVTATKQTAMLVSTTEAVAGEFTPVIKAMGTVIPEQEIRLSPRVGGEIMALSPSFSPGGYINEGDLLIEIDPADYEVALLERESALRRAVADLEVELGRQDIARRDFEFLGDELSPENEALVLRQPQLNTARANVEAARAAVRRAELDLERTQLRAPFDAHILSRSANVGSLVSPGDDLGHLVAIDEYWVEVAVPVSKISQIAFPESEGLEPSAVKVRNRTAWEEDRFRSGRVDRLINALDGQTRLARILVAIKDPLARNEASGQPALIVGSYVEAHIEGKPLENVVRVQRDHLRKNDTVWVKEEGVLHIREVDIVLLDDQYAYIRTGLEAGDQIVTTNLSTVVDGAPLRLEGNTE